MFLSEFDQEGLRDRIENGGSFQVIITPLFPRLFENVWLATKALKTVLEENGYTVLVDDRNQKPKNMFKVAAFLRIPNRITISGRSLESHVYEYFNLESDERCKVPMDDITDFLKLRINSN